MMPLTYVELFAGAGGLSRGLEMAGWACVAHAEWDAHARAVLRRHWPDTPLFGDVSTLTGQMIHDASGGRPVTMLTGGSPCQDLSIAGKRAGMTEGSGTRSALYFHQVRLWHELNAISPCPYLLWENVLGAFSSNHGKDFAAVLSALVGTPVAVPEDGWKGGGGVVSGCAGVAAWRVLDCQFFGPPQRRRRVFVLGVRAGGADPAEVLSLLESVSGHFESSCTARQDTPSNAGTGVAGGGDSVRLFDSFNQKADIVSATLSDGESGRPIVFPGVAAFAQNASGELRVGEIAGALGTNSNASGRSTPMVFGVISEPTVGQAVASVFDARGNGTGSVDTTLPGDHLNRITDYTPVVIPILEANARQGLSKEGSVGIGKDGDPMFTLQATVQNGVFVSHAMGAVVMRQREGKAGGGKGPLVSDKSLTLTATSDQILFTQQALGEYADKGVASSIKERDHKDKIGRVLVVAPTLAAGAHPGSYNGQDGAQVAAAILAAATDDDALAVNVSNGAASVDNVMGTLGARSGGSEVGAQTRGVVMASLVRPRRLMPIECERLMGWPDRWTERGIDEQGRDYALSDSARYKLCGNGVASPVAGWIGWRLRDTLEAS